MALVVHLSFCKILRKETQIHISCFQYLLHFFFYCDAAESQPFCKQHVKITCDARESRFSLQFCTLGSSKVGIIPFLKHNRIAIEELPGNIVKAERYAFSTQALSHMTSLGSKTAQWVWHPSQHYFLFAYKKHLSLKIRSDHQLFNWFITGLFWTCVLYLQTQFCLGGWDYARQI